MYASIVQNVEKVNPGTPPHLLHLNILIINQEGSEITLDLYCRFDTIRIRYIAVCTLEFGTPLPLPDSALAIFGRMHIRL